jgi:ankyrin repeat protein
MSTTLTTELNRENQDPGRWPGSTGTAKPATVDIHTASVTGDRATVHLHLARGVEPGAISAEGWAPLHLAASVGDERMVQLLLAAGARVDQRSRPPGACMGATPLHCAVAAGHTPVVEQLLGAGACTESRDDAGYTALHLAAERGDYRTVRSLVKARADVDTGLGDSCPLTLARRGRHHQVVALLKQVGARATA